MAKIERIKKFGEWAQEELNQTPEVETLRREWLKGIIAVMEQLNK